MQVSWYFDFVSPYAYLQSCRLAQLSQGHQWTAIPVLFAGMLKHFGHLGPAEIPAKRVFTYQQVVWQAARDNIPLKFPPGHPFNPLPLLRMCIACGNTSAAIRTIFDFVWRDGNSPDDDKAMQELSEQLSLNRNDWDSADVKARLKRNTQDAVNKGIFGVPTLAYGDQLFWGYDATPMALEYAAGAAVFDSEEMRRVGELPVLKGRPR